MQTEASKSIVLTLVLAISEPSLLWAQHDSHPAGDSVHTHVDRRFSHNQTYLDQGYTVPGDPRSGVQVQHGGRIYWYDRGQWYRRSGNGSTVVVAPYGALVPELPSNYSTVWFGGEPYFYANDTYYIQDSDRARYRVVEPPAAVESGIATQREISYDLFTYLKNARTLEQQRTDHHRCHRTAVEQTVFDPTLSSGAPADSEAGRRAEYMQAQAACLSAQGYIVR